MKRSASLLWPLLVGGLSLGLTAWLWQHEQDLEDRALRDNFDFGVRQMASRIDARTGSFEQLLLGVRGLFDGSDDVTAEDFSRYVESLSTGSGFAGLSSVAFAPVLTAGQLAVQLAKQGRSGAAAFTPDPPGSRLRIAPLTYAAPRVDPMTGALGKDLLADPLSAEAMGQAAESGRMTITHLLRTSNATTAADTGFLLFLPLYDKDRDISTAAVRRQHLVGWVLVSFRVAELMASLYGEGTPGLDLRIHDGVELSDATQLYPIVRASQPPLPARLEAQEYLGLAGHTWTMSVRSTPEFDQRHRSDSPRIIAVAGGGLSLALALLSWQLATGRMRAHAAALAMTRQLRESSERYRRIVDTADEGIWLVDAANRTTFVNPKLERMLGYRADELLGRRWFELMDDQSRALLAGAGDAKRQQDHTEQLDIRLLRKDGAELWATLSTSPILDEKGADAGALAMLTDVTEHKRAQANRAQLEDQLRQSQKMEAIGTLAGGIAHDFNNILAAILGNAGLAGQQVPADHPAAGHLAQIRRAGERGRSLVQQIVAFSRQQPQQRLSQALQPLFEDTAELLRPMLPAGVELVLQLSPRELRVSADATQLQQVLMNLCTNAWHALHGHVGRVVISLDEWAADAQAASPFGDLPSGRYAHVRVSDDGCGMDEATQQRIFEPFFTTKPVGQGTGLGLSVVHGIVKLHGGAIRVDSAPGQGSRFELVLPLETVLADAEPAATPSAMATPQAATARGHGEHVLYVDDDPVMVVLVESLLQQAGFRVTCLDDPNEALQRAGSPGEAIDLVITDFNMPGLSGLDIARALQQQRPGLPVVISTGFVTEQLLSQARQAGVRAVLQKEYTLEQLVGVVHQLLDGASTERA